MEFKTCTKCKESLPATTEYFHKRKRGKYGVDSTCKKCEYDIHKRYKINNSEKFKEYNMNYRIKNNDKIKEKSKHYRLQNKELVKSWNGKNVTELCDSYIAVVLGKSIKDIPKELIETKRLIIQLRRELKNAD